MCLYHVCVPCSQRGQKRDLDPLEHGDLDPLEHGDLDPLELQTDELLCVLRREPRSSARATRALNTEPSLQLIFTKFLHCSGHVLIA